METITERCGFHIDRISVKHCGNYEESYEIAYVGTIKPSAFKLLEKTPYDTCILN